MIIFIEQKQNDVYIE